MVANTVQDIIIRIHNEFVNPNMETSFISKFKALEEIPPIISYANECLKDISKTYSSKVIQFDEELNSFTR